MSKMVGNHRERIALIAGRQAQIIPMAISARDHSDGVTSSPELLVLSCSEG